MRRRAFLVVGAVVGLVAGSAAPAAAVDPLPGTPIPDEGLITPLADAATDALPFDLDGDGVRELLVSGDVDGSPGFAAIEAWWIAADGSTRRSNQVPIRRALSVDELYLGPATLQPDEQGMIATRIGEPATFVVVQRDGRDAVLVATTGTSQSLGIVPCCLTIWELSTTGSGQIELNLVADTQASGTNLAVLDLDEDGTDELVVNEATQSDTGAPLDFVLLRWTGSAFDSERIPIPDSRACCTRFLAVGDTDGVLGQELLFGASKDIAAEPTLRRLSLRSGRPTFEQTALIADTAQVFHLADGPTLVTAGGRLLERWLWPRDGGIERLSVRNNPGVVLDVLGVGDDTLLLVSPEAEPSSVLAIPGDVPEQAQFVVSMARDTRSGALNALALRSPFAMSYPALAWPVPGGVPSPDGLSTDAFVFSGGLIREPTPPDRPVVVPVALLPGQVMFGAAGPDLSWMSIWTAPDDGVFLPPQPNPSPHESLVDLLSHWQPGGLTLVATGVVLTAEVKHSGLEPTFTGVAPDPERPGSLLVGSEAVDATVEGPPGTRIWWSTRGASGQTTIGPDGRATLRLLEPAGPDAPDGSGATPTVWAITPAGHAYHGSWRIRVFRQAPDLGLDADLPIIDFDPEVAGQTLPGSTVTVNGAAATVALDGSFAMPVDVGILPTDFRVVATDPVGNQTVRVASRVWPFDYRQLPFVPIVVLITVAAGLALYVRRPDTGRARPPQDDDATFEEIGG